MPLEIPVPPGFVSAFLFILFDLLVLTNLDIALSQLLSKLYYQTIFHRGLPLKVKQVDCPCITTFLIGRHFFYPRYNIVAFLLKIGYLAAILAVDVNLDAVIRPRYTARLFSSTYLFDPSDRYWPPSEKVIIRTVERQWANSRQCQQVDDGTQFIKYYSLVFNLSKDDNGDEVIVEDETVEVPSVTQVDNLTTFPVDYPSIQCLKPDFVQETDTSLLATVVGCSNLTSLTSTLIHGDERGPEMTRRCSSFSHMNVPIELQFGAPYFTGFQRIPEGTKVVAFGTYRYPSTFWSSSLLAYAISSNSTLYCSQTNFGILDPPSPDIIRDVKTFMGCLFVIPQYNSSNQTLIEHWTYDKETKSLRREYAGPIFAGDVQVSSFQAVNLLQMTQRLLDFRIFSSIIVAEATIYQRFPTLSSKRVKKPVGRTYTIIPWFAVNITIILTVSTAIARCMVFAFNWGNEEPQLNTIDGLSSVAREENFPTGRSDVQGRPIVVGYTVGEGGHLHFGPLNDMNRAVRRTGDVDVV